MRVNHWQHNDNVDNTYDTYSCCLLPSGSKDWKTLLACSDGDSGPTRDISYRETGSKEKQIDVKEIKEREKGGEREEN